MERESVARLDRRLVMSGLIGLASSLGLRTASAQQAAPTAIVDGDCGVEPGIQMLFDWRAGLPVYPTVAESGPQVDWVPFNHPGLLPPYLIPPQWTGLAGWCDSFSETGRPNWEDTPMQLPWLNLNRVLSPDGSAAFEYAVGNIQGQPLLPLQVAQIAKQSLVGEEPELEEICLIDASADPLAPSWFTADYWEDSILITSGTALGLPDIYLPATTVTFQSIIAPREDLEELMYDVYLRILFQFLGGPGGDDDDGGNGGDDGDDPDDPDDDGDDPEGPDDDGDDDGEG